MTKVSIITISYNNEVGLRKTIDSVFMQDFTDYEYIVIDGGSHDNTKNILESLSDKIDYWISEPDNGVYHAMNKGIKVAKGEYLHFLNSGDTYAGNTILSDIFFHTYSVPLIRTVQILDYGTHQKLWNNLGKKEVTVYDMYTNTMLHQATFIRRDMFEKYGMYDETLKIVSDWKFFLKTILGGEKTIFLDIQSVVFEMGGLSTDRNYGQLHMDERSRVLAELMPINSIPDYEDLKRLKTHNDLFVFIISHSLVLKFNKLIKKIYSFLKL